MGVFWGGSVGNEPDREKIGLFIGARTETPDWLPSFADAMADRLDTTLEWFPWLDIDWRSGTPAICIGTPSPGPAPYGFLSLSDLKKHVFHLGYDATDFYLSTRDEGEPVRQAKIEQIAQLLSDGGAPSIVARMRAHATSVEAQVLDALNGLR